jgi:pyruvate/2-oxoacid:ferredoxin oxidoreductase alpha subunit
VLPFIYGLGGRDIFPDNIEQAFAELENAAQSTKRVSTERRYLNLRKD